MQERPPPRPNQTIQEDSAQQSSSFGQDGYRSVDLIKEDNNTSEQQVKKSTTLSKRAAFAKKEADGAAGTGKATIGFEAGQKVLS